MIISFILLKKSTFVNIEKIGFNNKKLKIINFKVIKKGLLS